jgi:hypothetical protein
MNPEQTPENIVEQLGTVPTYDEQMEEFLKQLAENIDPTDYMTPTQREIARLSLDELTAEYELVQQKISTRSSAQRRFITQRYEHEQEVLNMQTETDV